MYVYFTFNVIHDQRLQGGGSRCSLAHAGLIKIAQGANSNESRYFIEADADFI